MNLLLFTKFSFTTSLLCGVLFSFSIHSAQAQKNFLPGEVITKAGDTLSGYIDYRNWRRNPTEISFKSSKSATSKKYTPFDIQEFSVEDEHYVSAMVEREKSSKRTDALTDETFLRLDVTTAFLQTLVEGSKSLYYLSDVQGIDQFYVKQDSSYQLLIYKRYIVKQRHRRVIGENRTFVRQLENYLIDCPAIIEKLRNIKYNKYELKNLFKHYYQCTSPEIAFSKQPERESLEIGLLAGASLTSLSFFNENVAPSLTKANYSRSTDFAVGVFLNIVLPRNLKRWIITNEITYSSYRVSGRYSTIIDENNFQHIDTEFGYSYLKMNNMLRYHHPSTPAIFANIGLSNGWAIREINYGREETVLGGAENVIEDKALADTRLFEQGLLAGLGVQQEKLSLEVRYERGNGMEIYSPLRALTTRWYLLLGYRF
ncbi:MAG: hypothetical protein AAF632_22720 [Bacteroidota bacterium]